MDIFKVGEIVRVKTVRELGEKKNCLFLKDCGGKRLKVKHADKMWIDLDISNIKVKHMILDYDKTTMGCPIEFVEKVNKIRLNDKLFEL